MKPWLFLSLAASLAWAQTRVDLKSQSKNIDFSGATSVKPIPVGTVLPVTCGAGELFFKSNALAGENLFGCVAANTWAAQNNGSPVVNGFSCF